MEELGSTMERWLENNRPNLTLAQERYLAKAKEGREERNRRLAERYSCVRCLDTGSYKEYTDSGEWVVRRCDNCADRIESERLKAGMESRRSYAGVPGSFRKATFANFEDRDQVLVNAANIAINYASRVNSWPWLVMVSKPGTGKTHLAAAIANFRIEAVNSPKARWISVPRWLNLLRQGFSNGRYQETLEDAMAAPCLVLDDLGAEYHRQRLGDAESWASEQLYLVINHRYEERKETVITSNVPMEKLPKRLADRISDRGTQLARVVIMETTSYRTGG